jgi:hypothetical protein
MNWTDISDVSVVFSQKFNVAGGIFTLYTRNSNIQNIKIQSKNKIELDLKSAVRSKISSVKRCRRRLDTTLAIPHSSELHAMSGFWNSRFVNLITFETWICMETK